jgi:hypothetical protein
MIVGDYEVGEIAGAGVRRGRLPGATTGPGNDRASLVGGAARQRCA